MSGMQLLARFANRKKTPLQHANELMRGLLEKTGYSAFDCAFLSVGEERITRDGWHRLFGTFAPRLVRKRVVTVYSYALTPPFSHNGEVMVPDLPLRKKTMSRTITIGVKVQADPLPGHEAPVALDYPNAPSVHLQDFFLGCAAHYLNRKLVDKYRMHVPFIPIKDGSAPGLLITDSEDPDLPRLKCRPFLREMDAVIDSLVARELKVREDRMMLNLFQD